MSDAQIRNAYQRKIAVMAKAKAIAPDKTHPHHGFAYISIQELSGKLAGFLAEEGLDHDIDFPADDPGFVHSILTNVDDPNDQIVRRFPIVAGDKAFAYTIKFPLIRRFLVGDGEEGDESQNANASGDTASELARQRRASSQQRQQSRDTNIPEDAPAGQPTHDPTKDISESELAALEELAKTMERPWGVPNLKARLKAFGYDATVKAMVEAGAKPAEKPAEEQAA